MRLFILATTLFLTFSTLLTADVPQSERVALIAIYNSTNGATWTDNTRWDSNDPCTNDWHGVTCDDGNTTIIELSLFENNLVGNLPAEIGDLTNLTYLSLHINQLTGEIPAEIKDLSQLNFIIMFDNYYIYSDDITVQTFIDDVELGNTYFEIFYSNKAGEDYHALLDFYESTNGDNWTNNSNWGLGDPCLNSWHGVMCEETDTHVVKLQLSNNNLTGTIPLEIDDFENLTHIYLNANQLGGTIPPKTGNMTKLIDLALDYNNLRGSIPATIENLSINLTKLSLSHNKLSGEIPQEITSLGLDNLYLIYNCHLYTDDLSVQSYIDSVTNGGTYQDILNTNSNDCANVAPIIMYLLD